ncbi:CBS domain-containing protein [Marinobacter daqiaonensis]|uniref:CBS domain-containing protein n=1 Tax=Marinobacter daqiaonensis TaxID=650891 RepID=A0A1I6JAA0_9GAMM|nr:CBS domain-containing protein [Marinobacter daqiaonensis]SFR75935.1 CBS domain-containing protein [Marinobacter daqiaonensis]
MQVKDVMTKQPQYLDSDVSIREVARAMSERNTGFEPLVKDNKVTGVVTDRDIALRAFAERKNLDDKASTIATEKVLYTYEDEDVENVIQNMADQNVQRLLVLNNPDNKDLSGIVTVGDIADHCQDDAMAKKLVNCARHYH